MNKTEIIKKTMSKLLYIDNKVNSIKKPSHLRKCKYIPSSQFNEYHEDRYDEKIEGFLEILDYIELEHIELVIELNNMLKKEDRDPKICDLEQQMKEMQVKKYITVKEFEKIYNISSSKQKGYRSRLNDPLPYHQKVQGEKNVYMV